MLALNSQHSQHRGFPGTERNVEITNLRIGRVGSALLHSLVTSQKTEAGWKAKIKIFQEMTVRGGSVSVSVINHEDKLEQGMLSGF